jgi:hypothetical protein
MPADRSLVALGLLLAVVACQPDPRDPGAATVARIDGGVVTLGDFERYLQANLVPGDEKPSTLVRSRLFDAFIEERALQAEAERVGTDVATLEAEAWRRAMERNPVRDAELRAYLTEHRARLADRRRITLRSLPMGSMEEATGVRRRIERKETTFDEAGQGLPRTLIWQELPEGLRAALEGLRPGEVSVPVEMHGEVFLFRIESRGGEDPPTHEALEELARLELLERRRTEAHRVWIEEVLRRSRVEPETDNLPFRYVSRPEP